jgi:chromate reductase
MGKNIGWIVGSLRRESINRRLVQAVIKLSPAGHTFTELRIDDLPLYNQDEDSNQPVATQRLKAAIRGVDGVIFATPEYNRGIPGVLKNALDHASRPYGQNAWAGKPAGILGASVGAIGTAVAQQQLRAMLGYLDMPTLGQPEVFITVKEGFFDASGDIVNDGTRKFLGGWAEKYLAWVERFGS